MNCFRIPARTSDIPGYGETRRNLLICSPAVLLSLLSSPCRLLAAINDEREATELGAFLDSTGERALRLKTDNSRAGQEKYVEFLAKSVVSVNDVPDTGISADSWKGLDPGVFLGTGGRNRAFFVVHWKLAPFALLPAHCHPKTTVCTLGLQGESVLRHFDAEADAPSYRDDHETEFVVRETRRMELGRGGISTLTEHRDNIHLFQAGASGCRGIDVTTDHGGDGSFSFLALDHDRPLDSAENTFLARWTGKSPPTWD